MMLENGSTRILSISEQLYRMLLQLYPAEHRREYGPLMAQVFRDMCHDAHLQSGTFGLMRLWSYTLSDVARTTVTEHLAKRGMKLMSNVKIDRYEVKKEIGSGSASTVYLVHDPENQRDVVVKRWKPSETFAPALLKREADAMTQLKHPGIPEVYDFVDNDDLPYYVMEYIEGSDLLTLVESQEEFLPEQDIIEWGVKVCDILIHMHNHKPEPFLFRDMCPSNIIVDDAGNVHIIDFGITVPYIENREYAKIGTEGYASPEQYKGIVDLRSDTYTLGASLHHIATRFDPRPKQNAQSRPFVFGPPRAANSALSKAFAAVIMKAISFEPEDRYQSAEEMKSALLACL